MREDISVATDFERQIRAKELEMSNEIKEEIEKERKKSPYSKWIQVNNSTDAYKVEDWLVANSPTAYRVFRFLASNMDNFNAVICSYRVLQEKLGYSKATIERAIKFLREHKYIKVVRTGGSNIYMINKALYWNSWGSNYAYAEFGAKIIISSSEQDELTQNEIEIQIKKHKEVVVKED